MRNDCVDCLRGVGIFIIVWSHISLGILLDEIVNPIVLGVFFILSGMFYRSMPLYDLLRSKGKRLISPWLIFVVMGYVYHWLYSFVDSKPFDYLMLIEDLYIGDDYRANIPCWFLISLFEVMLIYALLEKYIQSRGRRIVVLLVISIIGNIMLCEGWNYFYIGKTLFYISLFGAGNMFLKPLKRLRGGGDFVMAATTLLLVKVYVIDNQFADYCLGWIVALCITVGIFSVCGNIKNTNVLAATLCFLGKNSLVILSFHILVLDFVWRLLYPCFGTPGTILSFFISIIVTTLCVPMIYVYNNIMLSKLWKRDE